MPLPAIPAKLAGVDPIELAAAVLALRPVNPHVVPPALVELAGADGPVVVVDDLANAPDDALDRAVTVHELYELHRAGRGDLLGPKGCPFCL